LNGKDFLNCTKLLIIDEVSTLPQHLFGKMSEYFRRLFCNEFMFGGVHVLIIGDWLQQLAIASNSLFQPPFNLEGEHSSKSKHRQYLHSTKGYQAYQALNAAFILRENMRHKDKEFAAHLQSLRFGKANQATVDYFNRHCWHPENNYDMIEIQAIDDISFCPIVCTSNELRRDFNEASILRFAEQNEVFEFKARIVNKKYHEHFNSYQNTRDDKSGGIPFVLRIGRGMPISFTKNMSHGIFNGALGFVDHIVHHPDNVVTRSAEDSRIRACSHMPQLVLVRMLKKTGTQFAPSLPQDTVAYPWCKEAWPVNVELGKNSTVAMRLQQFAIIPAYAITSEKCQGLTLERSVIAPWRHETRFAPQKTALYVMLSRTKEVQNMRFMQPLSMEDIRFFTPPKESINETIRLEKLALQNKTCHLLS
jgi:hypothetical protein